MFGVNLELVSIGLDVLRTLDFDVLKDVGFRCSKGRWILTIFQGSGWFSVGSVLGLFSIGSIGFGLSVYPKKEEVDRYWISGWFFAEGVPSEQELDKFLGRFWTLDRLMLYQSTSGSKVYRLC